MPIRINLLAEEQSAEEMRRRDPIKRAMFGGCALVILMLLWIASTQMSVSAARRELADYDARLKKVDDSSRQVKGNQAASDDAGMRLKALDRYGRSRFFWGTFLDAVQHAAVESVRVMEIKSDQKYNGGDVNKFFTTNITVAYNPPAPFWQFWANRNNQQPVPLLVSNVLATLTNKPPFTTNVLAYSIKITENATNAALKQVLTTAEFSSVPWAMERVTVEIRGRDYGTPAGASIDDFARRINSSPYFKEILEPGQGFRFTERPPQSRPDPQDPVNPNAMFVPFTIELVLNERILTNE